MRIYILQDGLRSLLLVATSLDDECQYNAAVIYRKLCADRHTHDYVVGRGGLQALLGLVQLRGLGTQRQAAAALRDVCSNKDHKVRFGRRVCVGCLRFGRIGNIFHVRLTKKGSRLLMLNRDRESSWSWKTSRLNAVACDVFVVCSSKQYGFVV